jgi:hypothetical protein
MLKVNKKQELQTNLDSGGEACENDLVKVDCGD